MTNWKKEAIKELCDKIVKSGKRAFISKTGEYGFYTDQEGASIVCFQCGFSGLEFSGNYRAVNRQDAGYVGRGWRLDCQPANFETNPHPPAWATRGLKVRQVSLKEHLKDYQESSIYSEFTNEKL